MKTLNLYDWLIVFFVHEIAEDLPESKLMYDAIQRTGSGQNNLVFRVLDQISLNDDGITFSFSLSVSKLDTKDGGRSWTFVPVTDLNIDNTQKNCWEQAFQYIYSNYSSERKLLVTFSHGAAFGIDRNVDQITRPATGPQVGKDGKPLFNLVRHRRYSLDKTEMDELAERGWQPGDNVILQNKRNENNYLVRKNPGDPFCKALQILWISDLADALEKYLPDSGIDIVLMINCYMQLFDNGYLLRKKVQYLVAPESGMQAFGYDYEGLLKRINTNPLVANPSLVSGIIEDYKTLYVQQGRKGDLQQTAIFANDLKYYGLALQGFETLVEYISKNMNKLFGGLQHIRTDLVRNVTDNEDYQLIDAAFWIGLLALQFPDSDDLQVLQKWFKEINEKIVVASFIGDGPRQNDATQKARYGFSGISIFYPRELQEVKEEEVAWCAYFDKSIPSEFGKRSKWSKLLASYLRLLFIKQCLQATP